MPDEVGQAVLRLCRQKLMQEYLPRVEHCLEELSEEDLWWRAYETNNSAGNLLLHLAGNVRQWIVSGVGGAPDVRDRAAEFAQRTHRPKEELRLLLVDTLHEADRALERFNPEQLLETRRIQKFDVTCLEAILHVVEHFSQHLGQIVYITKLRTGKDLRFYDL